MESLMISSLCPQSQIEGTLLTPEQVEEISSRISETVLKHISKQLEKALESSSLEKKKTR